MHTCVLLSCCSVIAAVKNEHSVDELSTPYKKILLNQIQQHITTPLVGMEDSPQYPFSQQLQSQEDSPQFPFSQQMQSQEDISLSQSFDSAISHRKKGIPCKYVPQDGEMNSCDRCEQVFESHESYEQHTCFQMPASEDSEDMGSPAVLPAGESYSCDRCEKYFDSQQLYEQHECMKSPVVRPTDPMLNKTSAVEMMEEERNLDENGKHVEGNSQPPVDDVVSAISERVEAKSTTSGMKGTAIAQVISGLLGANKYSHDTSDNSSPTAVPTDHRQSITSW